MISDVRFSPLFSPPQLAGVPLKTLKNLQLPSFLVRPETYVKPHLYFWSGVPTIR
jgi:hypothetical protein